MTWSSKAKSRLLISACSATSAAVAGSAAFVVASKLQEKKFEERLEVEIHKAKVLYQQMYSTPSLTESDVKEAPEEDSTEDVGTDTQERVLVPIDPVAAALDAHHRYQPSDEDEDGRKSPVILNIFEEGNQTAPGEEVLEALLADRDPSQGPYIITKEEFLTAEPEYEQKRFTYYAGDDILVMDDDEYNPVDNDTVAGDDNLYRFGYGSGDPMVVYVRNEELEMDLHITKSTGKYAVEVMALDDDEPHLQHSQPRRFPLHRDD